MTVVYNPDPTKMRVGKCHHGSPSRRSLYTWPAGTLKQGEARCPTCRRVIQPTSRAAHGGFITLTPDQLRLSLAKAVGADVVDLVRKRFTACAFQLEGNEFMAGVYDSNADKAEARVKDALRRLRKIEKTIAPPAVPVAPTPTPDQIEKVTGRIAVAILDWEDGRACSPSTLDYVREACEALDVDLVDEARDRMSDALDDAMNQDAEFAVRDIGCWLAYRVLRSPATDRVPA